MVTVDKNEIDDLIERVQRIEETFVQIDNIWGSEFEELENFPSDPRMITNKTNEAVKGLQELKKEEKTVQDVLDAINFLVDADKLMGI